MLLRRLLPCLAILLVGTALLWAVPAWTFALESPSPSPLRDEATALAAPIAPGVVPGGVDFLLSQTVGTVPGVCATTPVITVTRGTDVYYCYTAINRSPVTLTAHALQDSDLGTLLDNYPFALRPGQRINTVDAGLTISDTIFDGTVKQSSWTAASPITSYSIITGTCTFPDISGTGTPLNLTDEGEANVNLPFAFPFYDILTNQTTVGNNGAIVLNNPSFNINLVNNLLPTANLPYGLAPFWDDLDDEAGNVLHGPFIYPQAANQTQAAAAPNLLAPPGLRAPQGGARYYVVLWDNRFHAPGPDLSTATFAAMMIAPGQGVDGYVFFCYRDTTFNDATNDFGASATIGINQNAATALQYSFNTARPEIAGSLDSFGIGFRPVDGESFIATAQAIVNTVGPEFTLNKTVGTEPEECAPTDTIAVSAGTEVYYCYEVINTSPDTATVHSLEDSELGTPFSNMPFDLAPGQRINTVDLGLTISATIVADTVNNATWIGNVPVGGGSMLTATDTATVTLGIPTATPTPSPTATSTPTSTPATTTTPTLLKLYLPLIRRSP